MIRAQRASRAQFTVTIPTPSATNQIATQNGMLSPKSDQLIVWHSPEPGTRAPFAFGYQAADEVFDRLRVARTDDEIRAAVRAVQKTMYEDPPAVFLGWARVARAVNGRAHAPRPGRSSPERSC